MDSLAALITNKTWKLYRLSPLYKFKVSHNSLEAYSAQLKKHLKAEYQQANEVINAKIYSVKNREAAKEGIPLLNEKYFLIKLQVMSQLLLL